MQINGRPVGHYKVTVNPGYFVVASFRMAVEGVGKLVLADAWFGLLAGEVCSEALRTHKARTVRKAVAAHVNIVVGERSAIILLDAVAAGESHTSFRHIEFSKFHIIYNIVEPEISHIQSAVEIDWLIKFVVAPTIIKLISSKRGGEALAGSPAITTDGNGRIGERITVVHLLSAASRDGNMSRCHLKTTPIYVIIRIKGVVGE